jgi:hypothetical protein
VCLDETSKQLIIETRAPIPQKPGQPARRDYEHQRNGVLEFGVNIGLGPEVSAPILLTL